MDSAGIRPGLSWGGGIQRLLGADFLEAGSWSVVHYSKSLEILVCARCGGGVGGGGVEEG